MKAAEIRKEANYAGMRVTLLGWLDGARCAVQVDVGYGDAVTPHPESADYPVLLEEFPAPKLMVYPHYTVVAEKLEAMISLGAANSRMKDYFDLWVLAKHSVFEGSVLREAINATLKRRGTAVPTEQPFGLSAGFAADTQKQMQWQGFLKKNRLEAMALEQVLAELQRFLLPPLQALAGGEPFTAAWNGEGWQ